MFVSTTPAELPGIKGTAFASAFSFVTLLVNSDGFYIWIAAYKHTSSRAKQPALEDIQTTLKRHIAHVAGGSFSAHASGKPSPERPDPLPGAETLTIYRDQHRGLLTYFQLNTILEGLYNSNLDFRVFFRNEDVVEQRYMVGDFVAQITETFAPHREPHKPSAAPSATPDEAPSAASETSPGVATASTGTSKRRNRQAHVEPKEPPPAYDHPAAEEDARQSIKTFITSYLEHPDVLTEKDRSDYAELCVTHHAREMTLYKFLHATAYTTLITMKKRIERCRRGLLDELIEVTHRRKPLIQTEPPDTLKDQADFVNEAQLRGYVMLFAAKMPLIANVQLHLEDMHDELYGKKSDLRVPYRSWKTLLAALRSDVDGLTEAIEQAREARMLYEQEQIHAEQETLSEIQRLRERSDNALSPATGTAISIVSNVFALFAVALTLVFQNNPFAQFPKSLSNVFDPKNKAGELDFLGLLALLLVAYFVLQFLAERALRGFTRLIRRDVRQDARYYYELDIHVDQPFKTEALEELFRDGTPPRGALATSSTSTSATSSTPATTSPLVSASPSHRRLAPPFKKPVRNSYRVERVDKSEALHKIYCEADICVRPASRRLERHRYLHTVLVYELMFHRPSQEHGYVLKDVRAVATHSRNLKADEIELLKRHIVENFINPCLSENWRFVTRPGTGRPVDAIMTVNVRGDQDDPIAAAVAVPAARPITVPAP
ncbi:MAG TPA: hypothetical protein VIG30_16765 [Ktedonobacterales bacterium]